MTLKSYIWGIRIVTLFSVGALAAVVAYVDPESSGLFGKVLFYALLFFVLSGLFNLILLRLRKRITNSENAFLQVGLSFRQSFLLALLASGLLLMQSLRVLIWWDGLLLLAGIFLIELFFLFRE